MCNISFNFELLSSFYLYQWRPIMPFDDITAQIVTVGPVMFYIKGLSSYVYLHAHLNDNNACVKTICY